MPCYSLVLNTVAKNGVTRNANFIINNADDFLNLGFVNYLDNTYVSYFLPQRNSF